MPPPRRSPVGRGLLAAAVVVTAGYAYGSLTAALPSPDDPDVFWVANLAAPFVALPFLVVSGLGHARAGLRLPLSLVLGALTGAAMVAGFYGLHRVGRDPNADAGQPETLAGAYGRWFSTFVLGRPGGMPWLAIGVIAGAAAGLLAWAWGTRGSRVAGVAGVAPLVLEPVARAAAGGTGVPLAGGYPRLPGNLAIWAAEAAVGFVAVWLVLRRGPTTRA
ncbi:MAG TPA: hypothetical protein VFN43_07595 [Humibacillus sp.]|nr:hypothetical protein [Humibacillus sp.]